MPKVKKKIKVGDEKMTGSEPEFSGQLSRNQIAIALNWYNYYGDHKKNQKWVYAYMAEAGYAASDIDKVKKTDTTEKNQNLASIARILSRGATNMELINAFTHRIKRIIDMPLPKVVVAATVKKIPERFNQVIADVDEVLDTFYRSEYRETQELTVDQSWKPTEIREAIKYYEDVLGDLSERDDLKARQASKYKIQLEQIIQKLSLLVVSKKREKTPRKPRAKKVKPAAKIVERLQYASDSAQHNAVSIDPAKILESTELYVFHTDYRVLTYYVAQEGKTLGVKGTSIVDYDETKSFNLTLRKPSEVLPDVMTLAKRALIKRLGELTTKKSAARPRINKKQLLLRNFK